jgi:8-oxo-dGTP pyrophosphatase MutT (NUDIX family)
LARYDEKKQEISAEIGFMMAYAAPAWNRALTGRDSRTVYRNKWFSIVKRDDYYSLEYGTPQVVILPVLENSIVMVRVRRHLINDETWEVPAGGSHENEIPAETARRELAEETGIHIRDLSRFTDMYHLAEIPSRSTELLIVLTVRITQQEFDSRCCHDDEEITEVRAFPIDELKSAIVRGELYLSSAIAIISKYIFENE